MTSASIAFPLTYHALGSADGKPPLVELQRAVDALQSDQLLIRVAYASVNPMDPKLQTHQFVPLTKPVVLGFDFSGTVVAVGSDSPAEHGGPPIRVGDEVFGFSSTGGCFADYCVVTRHLVLPRGPIPLPEAAAYGVAYCTAYEGLELTGGASKRAGQWAFIPGAAGGVGHFGAQMCLAWRMKVIGSASKPEAIALLKQLGVDHVIDYSKQDVVAEVLAITGGKGASLVWDSTYKDSSYAQSSACVASGGQWIILGVPGHRPDDAKHRRTVEERGAQAAFNDFGRWSYDLQLSLQRWKVRKGLEQAVVWYKEGKVKPHLDKTISYNAEAVQQSFNDIESGELGIAKAVVKVGK